jgi:hypothetical protein
MSKNAANPGHVQKSEHDEKIIRENELNDLRYVLNDVQGRRFLWKMLADCGIYESSFTGNNSETFFKEGSRKVGLKIMTDIMEASPESYLVMLKESKEKYNG